MKKITGNYEAQMSEGGEADLHKHLVSCKKNPNHSEFIPVNTFTLNHLPADHNDNDLYEFIKATADLTVRVDVKMTSPRRPEFWPETKISYPFYNLRDKVNLRTGSGMIRGRVDKFRDGKTDQHEYNNKRDLKCWCKTCQRSDTASRVWWEFYVETATHVVFDDIEASHTSLRLFYDTEESPVVSIDQVRVFRANVAGDLCMLKCVICDENLGDKLTMLWNRYLDIMEKVCVRYRKCRDKDRLAFIVSHPHGCLKQVSLGKWVNKYMMDDYYHKLTYTTCTCPGSSGAPVKCVGYRGGWGYQHVHSGSLNFKLNYSGNGYIIN